MQALGGDDDAVKNSGKDGFWLSMIVFSILAALYVARIMLDLFMAQRFMLAWRAWLTDRLTGDWLDGKAYYRAASSTTRSTTPTSASSATSTSSPPAMGRFPTFRTTTRRPRCCSARSTPSPR